MRASFPAELCEKFKNIQYMNMWENKLIARLTKIT